MTMKKLINILFLTLFALVSCTDELDNGKGHEDDGFVLNLYNSQLTKAIDNVQGSEYERTLKRLDCFFYVKGQTDQPCVYYSKVTLDEVGQAKVSLFVDESVINDIFPSGNTCDIFIIANIPGNPTFITGGAGTDMVTLGKTLLDVETEGYDEVDSPFVMAGTAEGRRDSKKNAEASVPLVRAAAKLTFSVNIPAWINVTDKDLTRRYMPVLTDIDGNLTLNAAFHNGAKKGYLKGNYPLEDADLFTSGDMSFEMVDTIEAEQPEDPGAPELPDTYVYTCTIPLYSYARVWDKGAHDAAYWTFDLPWGYDSTNDGQIDTWQPYYYQILVNGAERSLEPNHWYDMTVKVGILGSKIETLPIQLEVMSYYVIDWTEEDDQVSGDRYEEIEIENYKYLSVQDTLLVLNNTTSGVIKYSASHKIGIQFNTKETDIIDIPEETTTLGACYINSNPTKSTDPLVKELSSVSLKWTDGNFTDDHKGNLQFNHPFPNVTPPIYSPIYIYITIFLDLNGNDKLDAGTDEETFTSDVTIAQYPAMSVIPDWSTLRSIYVNGVRHTRSSDNDQYNVRYNGHRLGNASGIKNEDNDVNPRTNNPMYVISVSSFGANDRFSAPTLNPDGSLDIGNIRNNYYEYIIGDPRVRYNDIQMDNGDNYDMTQHWASGNAISYDSNGNIIRDEKGNIQYKTGTLKYYYPTASDGKSFQVVAPKFRIVSFNNASRKLCTPYGAAMRCATLQEDGFPAGRWRLPTIAEVQFIIMLQQQDVIADIFTSSGNSAYATASFSDVDKESRIALRENNGTTVWESRSGNNISVRCVYDEWYWGSGREAKTNQTPNANFTVTDVNNIVNVGDTYAFTWGDKYIYGER